MISVWVSTNMYSLKSNRTLLEISYNIQRKITITFRSVVGKHTESVMFINVNTYVMLTHTVWKLKNYVSVYFSHEVKMICML